MKCLDGMKPLQSIRKYCLHCVGSSPDVQACEAPSCLLWPYRLGKGRPSLKEIKAFCLECMNKEGNGTRLALQLVKKCPASECFLYPYRLGKNPRRKGIGKAGGNPEFLRKGGVS